MTVVQKCYTQKRQYFSNNLIVTSNLICINQAIQFVINKRQNELENVFIQWINHQMMMIIHNQLSPLFVMLNCIAFHRMVFIILPVGQTRSIRY